MARGDRTTLLKADLRRIYTDAIAFSVMVGTGETYIAAFALELGMGELVAGLVSSLPMVAGGIIQMVSPAAIGLLRSNRRWIVFCAIVQALSFVPLTIAAINGSIPVAMLFLVTTLYWGFGMATGPAWNTWVSTLVPRRIRAHYFARRSRAAHFAVLCGVVAGGVSLQYGERANHVLTVFAALFAVAGLARFVSASLLAGQNEPDPPDDDHRIVPMAALLARFRHGRDGRLLVYMLAVQCTVQISGPYFTPFMLGELDLSYGNYLLLIATSYCSRILVLPMLGSIVRRSGPRRVMWFAGFGILPLSAMWMLSGNLLWLFVIQLIAGMVWAAYELATFLMLFETIPEEERTSVLTTYNLAHAVATVAGASFGGFLLSSLGTGHEAYMAVFGISGLLRLVTLVFLVRAVREPALVTQPVETGELPTRIVAVRPQFGSVERPILTGLPSTHQSHSDREGSTTRGGSSSN